eukprot:gene8512-336_t
MTHYFKATKILNKKNLLLTSCALGSTLAFTKRFYSKEMEQKPSYSSIDVTKKNFQHITSEFKENLNDCIFVSFDFEMTGLLVSPNQELLSDTMQERYSKIRDSIQKLTALQIGVCLWKRDEKNKNKLIAIPYTFNLFPNKRDFVVSSAAFQFLASHNFDFNKVIKEGIPFLNQDQLEKFKREYKHSEFVQLDEKDVKYLNETVDYINCWFSLAKEGEQLKIPEKSPYHRRILYQRIPKWFNGITLETKSDNSGNSFLVVQKVSEEFQKDIEEIKYKKLLSQELGFTMIANLLMNSKKPLVGHNSLLDLVHFYQHFHKDLPEDVNEFKKDLKKQFPKIYDTKLLSLKTSILDDFLPIPDRHLENLYKTVTKPNHFLYPEFEIQIPNHQLSTNSKQAHNAGYDAFMTGVLFSKLLYHHSNSIDFNNINFNDQFLNTINMMRHNQNFKI